MLTPQDQDSVKTLSYTPTSGDGEAASTSSSVVGSVGGQTLPKPRDRKKVAKEKDDESEILDPANPFSGKFYAPPSPQKAGDLVSDILSNGSSGAGSRSSGTGRSDDSDDEHHEEVSKDKEDSFSSAVSEPDGSLRSDAPSTASPLRSYDADSQADSNTPLITPSKKTDRFWPRAKYAMQQKNFIIPTVSATFITLYLAAYASLALLQNKGMFIAFITNNPKFLTVPGIIAASLFAIGIAFAIKQFRNTVEHRIEEKNPDKILDKVLELQPKDKIIKSVRLEYGNNTHSNFTFSVLESENGFINIDKKVISRDNRIESVINDRPLFTALMTGIIVANVALPLGLYAAGGMNNVQMFYQSLITTNIGLSLLVASSMLALSILFLGVHYYNKTNCTNLVYPQENINPERVNEALIKKVNQDHRDVLKGSHEKEAKCSSLGLEQVVVTPYNDLERVYNIRGI